MCFVHLRERLYIIKKGKRGTRFKDYFYRYKKKENLFTKVLFFAR